MRSLCCLYHLYKALYDFQFINKKLLYWQLHIIKLTIYYVISTKYFVICPNYFPDDNINIVDNQQCNILNITNDIFLYQEAEMYSIPM